MAVVSFSHGLPGLRAPGMLQTPVATPESRAGWSRHVRRALWCCVCVVGPQARAGGDEPGS